MGINGTLAPIGQSGVMSVKRNLFFHMNLGGDIEKVHIYKKLRYWAFMLAMAGKILTRNA